jgi:hypothetical protein
MFSLVPAEERFRFPLPGSHPTYIISSVFSIAHNFSLAENFIRLKIKQYVTVMKVAMLGGQRVRGRAMMQDYDLRAMM